MNRVILITGASSGIGKETAKFFQTKNWKAATTTRAPEKAADLQKIADVECFRLDVNDILAARKFLPDSLFFKVVKSVILK